MSIWFRHSVRIARAERTRRIRQLERSAAWQSVLISGLVILSVGGGIAGYGIGNTLAEGDATLPLETVRIATTTFVLGLLIEFTRQTSKRLEHINVDYLLTTVTARELVLGIVLFVYSSALVKFTLPMLSVAVGLGLGTRSPTSTLLIVVAVVGVLALAVLLSVGLSFAVEYVTTRSALVKRYKTRLLMMLFVLVVFIWPIVGEVIALDPSIRIFGTLPSAWFADLALLGVPNVQSDFFFSMGAIALLTGGIPVLTVMTTILAIRVWETEPVDSVTLHRSRSLTGTGITERIFAGWVSRPVLTVARKRWLQERRVPRGLLIAGYILLALPIVYLPILASGEILAISTLLFCLLVAVGTGLAFGLELLGSEYPVLPMTLTSISGYQFVRGTVLAGTAVGAPIIVAGTVILGLGSPIGSIETIVITITGVLLCVCSLTLAAVIGMNTPYHEFWPTPIPFTGKTAYTGEGRGFLRIGTLLALVGFVYVPALLGYLPTVSDPITTTFSISPLTVRIGSLLLTTAITVGVSRVAYQRAVASYDQYTLS